MTEDVWQALCEEQPPGSFHHRLASPNYTYRPPTAPLRSTSPDQDARLAHREKYQTLNNTLERRKVPHPRPSVDAPADLSEQQLWKLTPKEKEAATIAAVEQEKHLAADAIRRQDAWEALGNEAREEARLASIAELRRIGWPITPARPAYSRPRRSKDIYDFSRRAAGGGGSPNIVTRVPINMRFLAEALRTTRTPNHDLRHSISLEEVLRPESLVKAFICSNTIHLPDILHLLPVGNHLHAGRHVPVHLHSELSTERHLRNEEFKAMFAQGDMPYNRGYNTPSLEVPQHLDCTPPRHATVLARFYSYHLGANLVKTYGLHTGTVESNLLVLDYGTFTRIAILSCHLIKSELKKSDGLWYIVDVPLLQRSQSPTSTTFETMLLTHLEHLRCPKPFLNSLRSKYDFSFVRAHLLTTRHGGSRFDFAQFGIGRLNTIARELLPPAKYEPTRLVVECRSIGVINADWWKGCYHLASGGSPTRKRVKQSSLRQQEAQIIAPSYKDLNSSPDTRSQTQWDELTDEIRALYHHHDLPPNRSTFNSIILSPSLSSTTNSIPHYLITGSIAYTESSLGTLTYAHDGTISSWGASFGCSVVIPGQYISDMSIEYDKGEKWDTVEPEKWAERVTVSHGKVVPYDRTSMEHIPSNR